MNKVRSIFHKINSLKNWFLHASKKKKLGVIVLFLIILLIATSPLRKKGVQYTTEPVTRGTVADIVSESGNITSNQVNVYSPSTGIIETTYVKNGDNVTVGQKLFSVKSTASPTEKSAAYAAYLQAQSTLQAANAQLYTLQSSLFSNWQTYMNQATNNMYQNGDGSANTSNRVQTQFTVPQTQWLASQAQYKNQQAVINQAQAAVNNASLAYQATQDITVTATALGVVGNLSLQVGSTVTAVGTSNNAPLGSSSTATAVPSGSSSPVLIIGNPQNLSIIVQINEVDRPKVVVGQKVSITFTALADKTLNGTVLAIDTFGTNTNGVITYNVTVSIDTMDQELQPGMTATVAIETQKHTDVLTVPNSAIKPYKGGKAVQVLNSKNVAVFVPVLIGLKGSARTEILKGVTEGMQVITGLKQPALPAGGGFGG